MTKRKARKQPEPSTADRITQARDRQLGIFQPEFMSVTEQVLEKLNDFLDSDADATDQDEATEVEPETEDVEVDE